jgi:N,N'-diacetyllegionaminate synthase
LKLMIKYIRESEKLEGDGIKVVNPATKAAKDKLARSITSKINISKGTIITEEMLCLKSPGTGMIWKQKDLIIGKMANKDIEPDCTLDAEDFVNVSDSVLN